MKPLDPSVVALIGTLYESGLRQREIVAELGIGHSSVTKYLKEAGIKPNPGRYPQPKGENSPNWKGDSATEDSKRIRAKKLYPLGKCERCDSDATDQHHVDGDVGNNEPGNIMRLCRRCHMAIDGRLERFRDAVGARGRKTDPKPCVECERLAKPLRYGLCSRCYDRHRRPARLTSEQRSEIARAAAFKRWAARKATA